MKMLQTKRFYAALILLLAAAAISFGSVAQGGDDPDKELKALYAKMDVAVKAKDIKALTQYLNDDFTFDIDGKTLKRAEAIGMFQKSFEQVGEISGVKTVVTKIQQVEGNYIVDSTQTLNATVTLPSGKKSQIEAVGKSRDWWIKMEDKGWKIIHSEDMGQKMTIDGKPVS